MPLTTKSASNQPRREYYSATLADFPVLMLKPSTTENSISSTSKTSW